jgi:DNA-binding CsgD family transcriptional regulator
MMGAVRHVLTQANSQIDVSPDWIANLPCAVAIAKSDCSVIAASSAMERLAQTSSIIGIQDGKIVLRDSQKAEQFVQAIEVPGRRHLVIGCDRTLTVLGIRFVTGTSTSLISVTEGVEPLQISIGPSHGLTRSEARIVEKLLTDKSVEEIADEVGVSPDTVRTHRKRAFAKLGIKSRSSLLAWYLRLLP